MDEQKFVIRFEGLSALAATEQAAMLQEVLKAAATDTRVDVVRDSGETMDMGATLVLLLGTPAIIAIAKGIANFIARERSSLIIETARGKVVFSGNSGDAAKIAAAFGQGKPAR